MLVRWADEHESSLDWEYLRWRCPCAECSGEGNLPGVLATLPMFRPGQTTMTDVNLTGRYGMSLMWPGPIDQQAYDEFIEMATDKSALHIVGEPMDQALLIHYLLSDASKYATGNIFRVNGGQAMPW